VGVWGSGGSEFAGYDYVQTDPPSNPSEGETWYDVDADGAFVYDGAGWVEMTVTDHGQLSGIQAGQHRSDSNIITTVDGQVDADTVDGSHASDLGSNPSADALRARESGGSENTQSGTRYYSNGFLLAASVQQGNSDNDSNAANGSITVTWEDGSSDTISKGAYDNGGTVTMTQLLRGRTGGSGGVYNFGVSQVDWQVDGNLYGDYCEIRFAVAEV